MAENKKKTTAPEILDIPEDDFASAAEKRATAKKAPSARRTARAQKDMAAKKPAPAKKPAAAKKDSAGAKAPAAKKQASGKAVSPAKKETSAQKETAAKKPPKTKKVRVEENPVAQPRSGSGSAEGRRVSKADESHKKAHPAGAKKKRKRKKLTPAALAANLLFSAGIAVMVTLCGMLIWRYTAFAEMKRTVEAQTFYDGTTVEGVDVSGMTLNEAVDYWQRNIESEYTKREVILNGAGKVTAVDMGYSSDYESVLYNAWSAGRRGSLEERYHAAVSRQHSPVSYGVERELYSDRAVNNYVIAVAEKIEVPAVDAAIESFDLNTYSFVLTDSHEGRALDGEALREDIIGALEAGGGDVSLKINPLLPTVTRENMATEYGMIASAVTNASSSSSNRIRNIQRAVSIINGTRVADGETFSFNKTVGERTTKRGFRRATAYSSGEVTEEIGGGICQVSTTLFNAAVKADMTIEERHNHSLTVSYVDRGKDAAVNWKSQDLKFTNHSGDDVYVCCFVTKDKRVRFGIFGRLLPNGETITLEGRTTDTIKYDTRYVLSAFLMPGETKVIEQGKNGYKAETYKIRWDAQGNEISRELLYKSNYKSRNEVIQYGK